jgi:hypothetical protein
VRIFGFLKVLGLALALCAGLGGCVSLFLEKAPHSVSATPAEPPVLAAFENDAAIKISQDWTERRAPILRERFQDALYGAAPAPYAAKVTKRTPLDLPETRAYADVEQWHVQVSDAGADGAPPLAFNMLVFTPKGARGPLPMLITQNFCGNRALFKRRPPEIAPALTKLYPGCESGNMDWLIEAILGKYISGPPIEKVLARGYALAAFYAGDVAADSAADAEAALQRLSGGRTPRTGALMAWAWAYSRAVDVLSADARFDPEKMILWGHSRNGKSALIALAFDPRIAGAIAHQSGRGGAALTRSTRGETVAQITKQYGFWFAPNYAHFAGREQTIPVDQHQLIALAAPRPILLTAARSDGWADPEGAFRAAKGATPAYQLFGSQGLRQPDMQSMDLGADLSFYIRNGNHGSTTRDWNTFLAWLDAHFATPAAAQ